MMPANKLFIVAVGVTLAVLIAIATYSFLVLRRRHKASWQSLVGQIAKVNRADMAALAEDLKGTASQEEPLDAAQIWNLTGGMEGLAVLEKNAEVFVSLAFHLQQEYPEALPVAERLRMQAREIRWHVERLRAAAERDHLQTSFSDYAQRAAAVYHSMVQTILDVYDRVGSPRLVELEAVL